MRPASGKRFESDFPVAVRVGFGGVRLSCDCDDNLFTGIRPSPNGIGVVALQDHVIAENGRRRDVRVDVGQGDRDSRQE